MQEQESTQAATHVKSLQQHKFFCVLGLLGCPQAQTYSLQSKKFVKKIMSNQSIVVLPCTQLQNSLLLSQEATQSCIICSTVCLQLEVNNIVNRDMQIKIYISSFLKELGFSRPSKQICHDISHVSSAFTHSTKLGPQSPHTQLYVG